MKLIPSIIKDLLKDSCELEVEVLDCGWVSDLLTHLYVPAAEMDIEISLNEGLINVQAWGDDSVYNCRVFDPHDIEFIDDLREYLIPMCENHEVHMRYPDEKSGNNPEASKTP
tara:strand:- start:80799 stop:81137 length:339 start_codon:yes stop_codon:yes gene_type:complete